MNSTVYPGAGDIYSMLLVVTALTQAHKDDKRSQLFPKQEKAQNRNKLEGILDL